MIQFAKGWSGTGRRRVMVGEKALHKARDQLGLESEYRCRLDSDHFRGGWSSGSRAKGLERGLSRRPRGNENSQHSWGGCWLKVVERASADGGLEGRHDLVE